MAAVSLAPFTPNDTGILRPGDYAMGRGDFFFSEIDANDAPTGGWVKIGNCPEMTFELSKEFFDHFKSTTGIRAQDAKIAISSSLTARLTPEELNEKNAELYFSAESEAYTNASIAGFTQHVMIASVVQGRYYELVSSAGQRAYGVDPSDLTVLRESDDTAAVLGTDFSVESAEGLILITSGGSILTAGAGVKVTLDAAAGADSMRQLKVLSRTSFNVSFLFYGESAETGRRVEFWIPKCSVAADGSVNLVTATDLINTPIALTALSRSGYDLAYIRPLPADVA